MNLRTFSLCVQLIRAICDVVATTGTVGNALGFTSSMKVVAHTVENKERFMLTARILSVTHLRLELTDAVHALRRF